ncbi:hypothetical protein L5D93_10950 [Paenibacillus thiaminolyticus]|nr:hypothetical protein [Paenibacillus thiaminolyticus]
MRFAEELVEGPPWAVFPSKATRPLLSLQLVLVLGAELELLSVALHRCQ